MVRRRFYGGNGVKLVWTIMNALDVDDTKDIIIDAPLYENLLPRFHDKLSKQRDFGTYCVYVWFEDCHMWFLSDVDSKISSIEKDKVCFYGDDRPFVAYRAVK